MWVGKTLRGQMQCLIPDKATFVNLLIEMHKVL
jgi:hypothetical protein